MNSLLDMWEKPAPGTNLIAGWHQWADAGSVSSGLPQYLVEHTKAKKIGEIKPDGFYLFQVPGFHHIMRPVVKLNEGHRESMQQKRNEFFYAQDGGQGFFIFLGEEPNQAESLYTSVFLDAVQELGVKRVAAVAGVYGAVPYDKDREVSCVYSSPSMKDELATYAVKFSNYEGGATISMYLADQAEARGVEFFRFCAFVPSYDFSRTALASQPIAIGEDMKAWYDLMVRLKFMFKLQIDLNDLENRSSELISEWGDKIEQVARAMPQLNIQAYMEEIDREFVERPFVPLSDVWEEELRNLLDDF